ncbi:probable amidase At4g34880 isoform X1 [Telopea speciosissima]|uniref:probable amidase At4g34880 isoform X1 n=2 Tax=Telopea speciosissima TaxID=54955 RepID=UPI001CC506F3|nr:probable amidase At4g34880 isoform X1 [Telopea speciosissima]
MAVQFHPYLSSFVVLQVLVSLQILISTNLISTLQCHGFSIKEASVSEIHQAFRENKLTSRKLVELYLEEIEKINPTLRAVIEVNPDALDQANKADLERNSIVRDGGRSSSFSGLHGIPILIKDNIATKDKLNTTIGSFALLGSVVPRDAGVVEKLRSAGAVILGKASLSEWCNFRSHSPIIGWCARSGQGKNPYVLSDKTCASSTGSAIAVSANMVAVSLGTETDGSIICPSDFNGVVGIKPTVGLTSRAGVIIISPRQDTIGPICRTVSDAVYVLDEIVGFDPRDAEATRDAEKFFPRDGYKQFLKADGLQGKRLGIVRKPFFNFPKGSVFAQAFEEHFNTLRQRGAVLVDNLEIANISSILDHSRSGEQMTMLAEFKIALNSYLSDLVTSPVRSLADIIAFNENHPDQERMKDLGQEKLLESEETSGINEEVRKAIENMERLSRDGFEKLMIENQLDAMVTPRASASSVLAIGGYPAINVPAGYGSDGLPFGICFGGLRGSEPKLIEIAYAFEQATKIRKPPSFKHIHVASSTHSDL